MCVCVRFLVFAGVGFESQHFTLNPLNILLYLFH